MQPTQKLSPFPPDDEYCAECGLPCGCLTRMCAECGYCTACCICVDDDSSESDNWADADEARAAGHPAYQGDDYQGPGLTAALVVDAETEAATFRACAPYLRDDEYCTHCGRDFDCLTLVCDGCSYCTTCCTCLSEPCSAEAATPASTYRAAGRYLMRHGWVQGAYYDATTGSFTPAACMVGAIATVCYGGPVDAPAQMFDHPGFAEFERALTFLDGYLVDEYGVVSYEFNDTPGREAAEVTAALFRAAKLWDRFQGGAA